MERARPLPNPGRPLGQEHALLAPQGARAPDDPPARHAAPAQPSQPAPLPRLPAARRAAAALPPARPRTRPRPPRRLADLGHAITAATVRAARAHPTSSTRRHPRRNPPRALQRPPRRPQQQDPPDLPPRLRLPSADPLIALVYLCCSGV